MRPLAMLTYLFRGLTAQPERGGALFDAVAHIARAPHWYREGEVPDTLDGRFAMVATVTALVMIRLETLGEDGNSLSVALTERFVEVMEVEHRELGLGDPKLGRTVRKLVGALARRIDLWRAALSGTSEWASAAADSVPGGAAGQAHAAKALRDLAERLGDRTLEQLGEGECA